MTYIVLDGPDGIGKTTLLNALKEEHETHGTVLDVVAHQKLRGETPELAEDVDTYFTAEPSHAGLGKIVREELIAADHYSAAEIASGYALDRSIQLRNLVVPALRAGKTVIQSRSYITSVIYQNLHGGEDLTQKDILDLPGNRYAEKHSPDAMIVPTVNHVDTLMERMGARGKNADIYERRAFQEKVLDIYNSDWLRRFSEKRGIHLVYVDVDCSKNEAQRRVVTAVNQVLGD